MVRSRLAAALLCAASLALITACSATTSGSGTVISAPSASPTAPGTTPSTTPGSSAGATPAGLTCPTVTDSAAHLSYPCITSGLTADPQGSTIWPESLSKTVEQSTGWSVDEGSGDAGDSGSLTTATATSEVRSAMVEAGNYGDSPTVTTVADKATTVDGRPAHLLQSTITLDPSWAATDGTKVRTEHLWIVAVQVSSGDITLWYTSVPDLVSSLWAKVPSVIAAITVI